MRAAPVALVVALAVVLLAAGLAGTGGDSGVPDASPRASGPGASAPVQAAGVLPEDCSLGFPVPPCNHWASRPPTGGSNEVHVAVNPLDPDHLLVVGKDYGLGPSSICRPSGALHTASASYVTKDAGRTWTVALVPGPYPGASEPSPLPYKCGSDPVAAFGPDGTAYYILLNFDYDGARKAAIAVARSPDGGETWPASDIRVLHTSPGDDKQWGTVDAAGRVHVVWTDLSTGAILYSRSDADFEFESPRQLGSAAGGNPAVVVAAGLADELIVLWRASNQIRFRTSVDGGATFNPMMSAFTVFPYETGGPPRFPFMPQIATDRDPASPFAGRIYLTWPDARDGDSAVYMAASGDWGATWTAAVRVDDNLLPGKRQVMPIVAVAPGGRVDIAWMDQRDDPGLAHPFATWRTYYAHSVDAGASWSMNHPVSREPLVAAWSLHQNGQVFIGDYIGVASTATRAWVSFSGNGAERLLLGLPPDAFERADAYVAEVVPDDFLALPVAASAGVVRSVFTWELPAPLRLAEGDPLDIFLT